MIAAAALMAIPTIATAQETTYQEDCTQGLLINRHRDNWFITAEGGGNFYMSPGDKAAAFKDRIGGNAALYVGKWVTPSFGFRFGASWIMPKGATTADGLYRKMNAPIHAGRQGYDAYYPEKFQGIGPELDVLVNLTNWWCGYRANRLYNGVFHIGAGAYWTFHRDYKEIDGVDELRWRSARNTVMFANAGVQNNFRVSDQVQLFIDVQYEYINFHNNASCDLALSAGITYNFPRQKWYCPVTAVCGEAAPVVDNGEINALRGRVAQLEKNNRALTAELNDCRNLPRPKDAEIFCDGLVTIYYPISDATLSDREKRILNSVANVMKNNPNQTYILTGWADNYTGDNEINTRLRNERVNGVKAYLEACGVNPDQLEAGIDNANLTDFGKSGASLDRAVTIRVKK